LGEHESLFSHLGSQLKPTYRRKAYKALGRLQKRLEPTSNIHDNRNVAALQTLVQEGVELLQSLPPSFPQGHFTPDIDIASKGILAVRRVAPKSTKKPILVLDEDFV